ncbi:MAG: hypothetical protein Q3966_04330 [Neisseria sp.]|nr:hypothetical protein [Neisseria sp.]
MDKPTSQTWQLTEQQAARLEELTDAAYRRQLEGEEPDELSALTDLAHIRPIDGEQAAWLRELFTSFAIDEATQAELFAHPWGIRIFDFGSTNYYVRADSAFFTKAIETGISKQGRWMPLEDVLRLYGRAQGQVK